MKRELFMLFLVCVLGNAFYATTIRRRLRSTVQKSYYINNWSEYNLPTQIGEEQLKEILTNIAKFKRLEYCPFGNMRACEKSNIKDIVSEIIKIVVKDSGADLNPNESGSSNNNATYTKENTNIIETIGNSTDKGRNEVLRQFSDIGLSLTDNLSLFSWFKPKALLELKYFLF